MIGKNWFGLAHALSTGRPREARTSGVNYFSSRPTILVRRLDGLLSMLRLSLILTVLLPASVIFAQPEWITIQNKNFRVYSSAGERATRNALSQLERIRGFFVQFTGITSDRSVPISVVMFGSEKEYLPYRLNAFAVAYYSNHSGRDLIVMGKLGAQSSQIAAHEYTHLVYRQAGYSLPPWLSEGLAELYSTLQPMGDDTEFGAVLIGRLQALHREPWVPMQIILAADAASPYYNETEQAGSLYNQGWALVHMLATTEQYRAKFPEVVQAINNGMPSGQALELAYGMPLAKLENALRYYIQGNTFRKLRAKIKLESIEKLTAQPADPFEVREVQADLLLGHRDREVEAHTRLEELAREAPGRPQPRVSLGYLAWRNGKPDEAVEHFATAFELGNRSPRMLLDFARLARRDKPESAAVALRTLLEMEPKNLDASFLLADLQMSQGQYSAAMATTREIASVRTTEERDNLLYMRAFAAMQLGKLTDARTLAKELKQVATSPHFQLKADEILRLADQR